ncbi:DUF1573 domain-containing protein [Sphingobacterium spiritivorum]|uniref:DUF1573 domain-containing protein n=1 Tax=Sphingobacterium spiritivorum ATCC 33861 TaxID=525373 RepID=D7VM67_SPHSI|nr:hypothetical protein HMPREF0766_12064 [Sphingobacterium spiritivorum ATCC 33861]QQT34668.1 DUF1573 domain-containing protein [Sphingobacterium spiritivorum]SUJ00788.1 Protein of uncharacterised function (DUF1573) [Sphingobacterium spiritivorum]
MVIKKLNQCFQLLIFVSIFSNWSCVDKSLKTKSEIVNEYGKFRFDSDFYDFGRIKNGDTVQHTFNYVNIGSEPLIIQDISTSCGCTLAEWTKIPVKTGSNGFITIKFSKTHDPGIHSKSVIIKANTEDTYTVLKIMADVLK